MNATRNEEWRPVVGHERSYEVSDQGRVRSLDRMVPSGHGALRFSRGRVLKPGTATSGHQHVVLAGKVTRTIHSLVADAFIGTAMPGAEVRHINGQPADCRAENLEYGSRSDNAEDSKRHGTHFHAGLTHCKRGHELSGDNLQKSASGKRTCLACRRERQSLYRAGKRVVPVGQCPNGHQMTPENRYTNGTGRTRCKPCASEKSRREVA